MSQAAESAAATGMHAAHKVYRSSTQLTDTLPLAVLVEKHVIGGSIFRENSGRDESVANWMGRAGKARHF